MSRGLTPVLLAVAALVIGGTARADDKSHKKAAEDVLKAMDVEKQLTDSYDTIVAAIVKNTPALADKKDELIKFYAKHLNYDSMKDDYIAIYTKAFTEDELKDLEKFYKTPLGKKLTSKTAELAGHMMELVAKKVQDPQFQDDLRELLQPK